MITLPEQVAWFKTILEGKAAYLRFAKQTINRPEVNEIAQTDYDCALAVMATLLATINAQQAVKNPGRDNGMRRGE